ncbi:hypothetical protein ACFYE9_11230 [Rhizobium leguminosarum]|uniref:Uncharacterized protein n=1 Tax=Rhizobium leguminosarum TaxID=384 RepID=A0ACD5F6Q3_RHILE|nr:hypothetical protein [Rhizobium leguminosarum]
MRKLEAIPGKVCSGFSVWNCEKGERQFQEKCGAVFRPELRKRLEVIPGKARSDFAGIA